MNVEVIGPQLADQFLDLTAAAASAKTCSGVIFSLFTMCDSDVAMKTWIRRLAAGSIASQHRSMSLRAVRDNPQIDGPSGLPTACATACTPSKSPCEAMGNPALFTIPQGGVEDDQLIAHDVVSFL